MTREEKAQAYDEALKRAKAAYGTGAYDDFTMEFIFPFPELAESEDERMIERIELSLHSLKQWINGCDEMQPSRKEECITEIKEQEAWLEKQKEQKPADLSEMMVHKEPYIAPVPTPMVADGQKPVKPSGKLSRKEYLYQLLIDQLITYSDYEYLTKQKPAEWSEEDEAAYTAFTCEVINEKMNPTLEQIKWLRSIRDRLKSLRHSWKPSEEQMSMLLAVINDPNNAGAESCQLALRDLYQDLKKLM